MAANPSDASHDGIQVEYGSSEKSHLLKDLNESEEPGTSSVAGAVFNFTNGMIGAGCVGMGGAIAQSGGFVSLFFLVLIAYMTKETFDLLIDMSVTAEGANGSYENLGRVAYGSLGRQSVVWSKFLFCFGCLVAYAKIVKDNFGSAARHMIALLAGPSFGGFHGLATDDNFITMVLGVTVMLPLCLLRDMSLLERASIVKITVVVGILAVLIYLYFANPGGQIRQPGVSFVDDWLVVRPGLIPNLGTFVYTFISQHTLHLTFLTLRPEIRDLYHWKQVSLYTILLAGALMILFGFFAYITFWENTPSNVLGRYPPLIAVDIAKLLLSSMMMLTYPFPFFTCRQLIVVSLPGSQDADIGKDSSTKWWFLRYEQLIRPLHVLVTIALWASSTLLAILAPSLGSILNLVGCATGTSMAFILPSLFAFKLQGCSFWPVFILAFGGTVGLFGTYLSVLALF